MMRQGNADWPASPGAVHKYTVVAWCLLENLLFTGLAYGWPLLVILLKADGVYSDLCENTETSRNSSHLPANSSEGPTPGECMEQDKTLNLVFTISVAILAVTTPAIGHVLYSRGVRITRIGVTLIVLSGLLLMAFASHELPWLIFPGLLFMVVGGIGLFSTNVQSAYLFGAGSSTVVSLLTGMFQSSSTVVLIIKYLHDIGISRQKSLLGMAGVFLIFTSINTIALSPKTFFQKKRSIKRIHRPLKASLSDPTAVPNLRECVMSRMFLSHITWYSLLHLRYLFFVGSFNTWLTALTGGLQEDVEFYTNLLLYIQLGGAAMCLASGFFLTFDRRRCSDKLTGAGRRLKPALISQTLGSILAVVLSAGILVPSTRTIVCLFVVSIGLRTNVYFMAASFPQMIFPVQYFGLLFGVTELIGATVGALQYPLFIWVNENPVGVQKVNMFLLGVSLASLTHPLHTWVTCRLAEQKLADGDKLQVNDYNFIRSRVSSKPTAMEIFSVFRPTKKNHLYKAEATAL